MGNQNLQPDEWVPTAGPSSAPGDSDDAITQYQFYDAGAAANSGYFWTADVGQRAANTYITIDADDLATTWLRGGAGHRRRDDVGARLQRRRLERLGPVHADHNGRRAGPNTPPVATINDQNLHINECDHAGEPSSASAMPTAMPSRSISSTMPARPPSSGYLWTANGGQRAAGEYITVAAADLDTRRVRGGQAAGSETDVGARLRRRRLERLGRVHVGHQEGQNTAPVVTIDNQSLQINEWVALPSCHQRHRCRWRRHHPVSVL